MAKKKSHTRFFKFFPDLLGKEFGDNKEKLNHYDVLVYACILAHSCDSQGNCFASHRTISREIDVSSDTVYRSINKLHRLGIIFSVLDIKGRPVHYKCIQPDALLSEEPMLYPQSKRVRQLSWEKDHPNVSGKSKLLKERKIIQYKVRTAK